MSLSLDKLRLLRKQAGDPKAVTPVGTRAAPPGAGPGSRQRCTAATGRALGVRLGRTGNPPQADRRCRACDGRRTVASTGSGQPAPPARPALAWWAAPARASAQDRQLPGEEIAPGLFLIESLQPQPIPAEPLSLAFARREHEHVAARDLLFFDTETTGLAGGTGTRAFMIGAADWHVCPQRGEGLRIRQLLMSTMAAEDAMLATFARWLQPSTVFCSYNGRSYDAPLLKTRYRLARQRCPISALDHVDLLYPTRRRYRGTWENCKLSTIERQLLRVVARG